MEAIVLAGGLGTRLKKITNDVPKSMVKIGERPFLDYLLVGLQRAGVTQIVLSTGYKGEIIQTHYGIKFGTVNILYSHENEPLGTGGAIKQALGFCKDNIVIILNGDTIFNINLKQLLDCHKTNGADVTVAVKEMHNFDRYGTVIAEGNCVVSFSEKKHTERGFINGGVYAVNTALFENVDLPDKFSFEEKVLHNNAFKIHAVPFNDEFIDIGVPEDYILAQELIPKMVLL